MGKKKSPMDWAYEHTTNLKNAKDTIRNISVNNEIDIYLENLTETEYKPGYWTILKNISLAYCINPFGVILKSYHIFDTVFLDLFSGSGITPLKDEASNDFKWIVGSPIISTQMTDHTFQKYIFGDINKKSLELLNQILESQNTYIKLNINYEILNPDDANTNFEKIYDQIKNKYVFAYIDPTGFQWNWKSMLKLTNLKRFDILMNFQTREIERILNSKRLEYFFGPDIDKINDCKNCDEILELYIDQLKKLNLKINSVKVGKDKTNQYYYHLLHISRRDSYSRIINDLKQRIETFSGDSIKSIWNDLDVGIRQKSILNGY
jgi:three-Cys-motif partner protein